MKAMSSTPSRKRIVFILPNLEVGGAEEMAVEFANAADDAGFAVNVVLLNGPDRLARYLSPGCRVSNLGIRRTRWSFLALLRCLRSLDPDVVLTTHHRTSMMVAAVKPFCRPFRHVSRLPSTPSAEIARAGKGDVSWKIYRRVYATRDLVIAQTPEMALDANESLGLNLPIVCLNKATDADSWRHLVIVKNPLPKYWFAPRDDVEDRLKLTSSNFMLLAAGRLSPVKGYDVLIRALAKARQDHNDLELFIAGRDDGEEARLRSLIKEVQLDGVVHLLGHRDDLRELMLQADLFVLSSHYEGYPNVLVQAMSTNIPVVATSCIPAINALITNGVNGYTAPPGSIDLLAAAIGNAKCLRRDRISNDSVANRATLDVLMHKLAAAS